MKAALVREYGPPTVVEIGERPEPDVANDEVLVRVRAASLNPIDSKLRSGSLRPFLRLHFPAILGFDLAGEVVRVGGGVTTWSAGDRVYGRLDAKTGGTHAELVAVDARVIDEIPSGLSFEQAAALPLTGMTALQALRKAGLKEGDRLLVNGASGGVGSLGVQVGRAWGAEVTAVCRGEDASLITELGASRILDYTKGELERCDERFDVILDTVFNRSVSFYTQFLTHRGTFITTDFSPTVAVKSVLGKLHLGPRVEWLISRADGEMMHELSELVRSGQVAAVVDSTYPLAKISAAYEQLENRHTRGKVVITTPA